MESGPLSSARIQKLGADVVTVKIDPRAVGRDHPAMEFKSTRYVPELVVLDHRGKLVETVDGGFDVETIAAAMEAGLRKVKGE